MRQVMLLAGLMIVLFANQLSAQGRNPLNPNLRAQLMATRSILEKERRLLLASELNLTREERDKFWPLFNEYVEDLHKVNDIRIDVIVRYAENFDNMTDDIAKSLIDERFRHDREFLKLQERYLKKMRRILSEIKVARFFQVESKLDAALNYNLASRIPVIQGPSRQ